MPFIQDIDHCFSDAIGPDGLARDSFEATLAATAPTLAFLRRRFDERSLPLLGLPGRRDDLEPLAAVARVLRGRYSDIVILGAGGSSLGAQALTALAGAKGPRLHFPDNLDGHGFAALLSGLKMRESCFLAISKSGGTAETLAQTLAAMAACVDAGLEAAVASHFLFISQPGDSAMRRLAARWGIAVLDHDPGLGGRYSVLSLVGLLPALLCGLDAGRVRGGAEAVLDQMLTAREPRQAPPAVGAALAVAMTRDNGLGTHVLMPYVDRLERFAMWYRQLWAESLGKDGHGSLPVRALGPVDQHSQLQLYLDGPADKFFTLITAESRGTGPAIATDLANDPALGYLAGRTIGDLVAAEAEATAATLARRGRPVRRIRLKHLNEATIGALLMHFMLETIIAGGLLGVDPFDQPAVEEGKRLARSTLEAQ
ncbi:MAG: hypothetical protein ACE5EM_04375 [Sphingomonadales bacterium]